MSLINSIFGWLIKKRMHQIELFVRYPHDVQQDWFRKLLHTAAKTEWGKAYDYASIRTAEEFKRRVPVNEYDGIKPFIDRIIAGEQNVLWPSEIRMFAKSSGTTADRSKFIPVSEESLEECHYKGGKDLFAIYYNAFPDSRLLEGRSLAIGGSSDFLPLNQQSYYGDLSAIIIKNLPVWASLHRTPDMQVALNPDWEVKLEQMAEITIKQNITSMVGVPSWSLVLLQRILEKTGQKQIRAVWPNFEAYVHGGVNFGPYRKQFDAVFGGHTPVNYFETYNASEGFFGLQDRAGADDMLLMLDYGIYYEFMPLDQLGADHPRTLELHEVECGVNYALIISTNAGLWRYLIGDTIQFTSLSPYRIKVCGRTRHFINAFGEELIVENAERALTIACEKCDISIAEYTAAPIYMGDGAGGHEWAVEFERPPANLAFFTELLDNALKALNTDYEAKRFHDKVLGPPLVRAVPKGTFYRWLKQRDKLGGQHKVPRLMNDRSVLDQVLQLVGSES